MKRSAIAIALASLYVLLAGCNTMAGAGQDIQAGGEKIEDAAKKNK